MSWINLKSNEYDDAVEKLAEHGYHEDIDFKTYTPGYNSIITGERRYSLPYKLLMVYNDEEKPIFKMIIS